MITLELKPGVRVTGVGSRKAPEDAQNVLRRVGYQVARYRAKGITGDAIGMDAAFYAGIRACIAELAIPMDEAEGLAEVWCPNDTGRGSYGGVPFRDGLGNFNHARIGVKQRKFLSAKLEAADIHPVWDRLDMYEKLLHTRNIFQILGAEMGTPSDLCVLWAPPQGRQFVDGGTNTAFRCAIEHDVPVYNIHHPDQLRLVLDWLEGLEHGIG